MPQSWCALPFSAVTFYADGSVAPCCKYVGRDTSKNFYSASPEEALTSSLFRDLQRQFQQGEKPSGCIKCWNAENQALPSFRTQCQDRWAWARPEKAQDSVPVQLKMIDVAFGNICNAACLTCDSVSSQKWISETEDLLKIEGNPFERWMYKAQSHAPEWTEEQLRHLEVALFDQSEPFLQPAFKNLIRTLKTSGALKKMSISLSTNASYWPDQMLLEDLSFAKSLEIQISVDATGDLFNYLRFPLKWENFNGFVNQWVDWSKDKINVSLIARMTLSALNLLHESKVNEWWKTKSSNRLNHGIVHNPWYLSPMSLPLSQRESLLRMNLHPRVLSGLSLSDDWHPSYQKTTENERLALLRTFLTGREQKRGLQLEKICTTTYHLIYS